MMRWYATKRVGRVRDVGGRQIDHQQSAAGAFTDWLSSMPPVGLAVRPARSRALSYELMFLPGR